MHRIAVIPGDGIGKEVVPVGVDVLNAVAKTSNHLAFDFEWHDYGADRYLKDGVGFPDAERNAIAERCDAIFLGAVGDPRVPGNEHARELILETRFNLDLYVNLRPCRLVDARLCPLANKTVDDVRFTVFRENTEGLYVGVGGIFKKGTPDEVAIQSSVNSAKGVERIIRRAYEYADRQGLKRVCMSDKSNALRYGHDLWQRVWKRVAAEYPHIESRHLYIDVLAMQLVRSPEDFDVIVTSNLFGDIITDLGAELQGGLGVASSANINPETRIGMFEPVHGSAPDIAGKGIANPTATVLAAALMIEHLGHAREARMIEKAVECSLIEGACTPDLGGNLDTAGASDYLISKVADLAAGM
jgi:3-isopropylmalate dehydrogenase